MHKGCFIFLKLRFFFKCLNIFFSTPIPPISIYSKNFKILKQSSIFFKAIHGRRRRKP